MKARRTDIVILLVTCALSVISACSEAPAVGPDLHDGMPAEYPTLSAKPKPNSCHIDGYNGSCYDWGWPYSIPNPPMYANLVPSGSNISNELTDPDGGIRVGHWIGFDARFDLIWDSTQNQFFDGGIRASAPECSGSFSMLQPDFSEGRVVSVILRGRGLDGRVWLSDPAVLDTPQEPEWPWVDPNEPGGDPEGDGWVLHIQKNVDVFATKGKSRQKVCTAYVHDLAFSYVPIP